VRVEWLCRRRQSTRALAGGWCVSPNGRATLGVSTLRGAPGRASDRTRRRWLIRTMIQPAREGLNRSMSFGADNLELVPLVVSFPSSIDPFGDGSVGFQLLEDFMRKPRPATYNPAQALHLIASDRTGSPLSCPSCSGSIERSPSLTPPAPHSHVTLRCTQCGRVARYIAGAA
jgi:hypothetical protein